MLERLDNGDTTSVREMITDWIDELEREEA